MPVKKMRPDAHPLVEVDFRAPRGKDGQLVLMNSGQTKIEVVVLNPERNNVLDGSHDEFKHFQGMGTPLVPGESYVIATSFDRSTYYDVGVYVLKDGGRSSSKPVMRVMLRAETTDPRNVQLEKAEPLPAKPLLPDQLNLITSRGMRCVQLVDPFPGLPKSIGVFSAEPAVQVYDATRNGLTYTVPASTLNETMAIVIYPIGWTIADLLYVGMKADHVFVPGGISLATVGTVIVVRFEVPPNVRHVQLTCQVQGLDNLGQLPTQDGLRVQEDVDHAQSNLPTLEMVAKALELALSSNGQAQEGNFTSKTIGDSFVIELTTYV